MFEHFWLPEGEVLSRFSSTTWFWHETPKICEWSMRLFLSWQDFDRLDSPRCLMEMGQIGLKVEASSYTHGISFQRHQNDPFRHLFITSPVHGSQCLNSPTTRDNKLVPDSSKMGFGLISFEWSFQRDGTWSTLHSDSPTTWKRESFTA